MDREQAGHPAHTYISDSKELEIKSQVQEEIVPQRNSVIEEYTQFPLLMYACTLRHTDRHTQKRDTHTLFTKKRKKKKKK